MPILSIIIPVYNASAFLRETLDSVLKQSMQDFEIICVNDGSTDGSLTILESYADKDSRVSVYTVENGGVSNARNFGLSKAIGKYVHFVDADDLLSVDMEEKMVNCCESHSLDMAICSYKTTSSDAITKYNVLANVPCSPSQLMSQCHDWHSSAILCFSWRMLFLRSLLIDNNIRYDSRISIGEDSLFNMTALCHSMKVIFNPEPLYVYRVGDQGVMSSPYKRNLERSLGVQYDEQKKLLERFPSVFPSDKELYEDVIKRYSFMLFDNVRRNPEEKLTDGISRVLSLPMMRDAMHKVGYRNIYSSLKEYLFFLAMKFRLVHVVSYMKYRQF